METQAVVDVVAIILSIVALIVTVLGFFASLKFYRDGMDLQAKASSALARIEEKAQSIQTQVGDMFGKTLDAAIGRNELEANLQALTDQLEATAQGITQSVVDQVGVAGDTERARIQEVVNEQLGSLRERVADTRETAEELAGVSVSDLIRTVNEAYRGTAKRTSPLLSYDDIVRSVYRRKEKSKSSDQQNAPDS